MKIKVERVMLNVASRSRMITISETFYVQHSPFNLQPFYSYAVMPALPRERAIRSGNVVG